MAEAKTDSAARKARPIPRGRKILPARFGRAEEKRNIWLVIPDDGTDYRELSDPGYWAHIAGKLRIGDRIEVYAEDGSYFAELMVRAKTNLAARVTELRKVDLEEVEELAVPGHEVQYRGLVEKHAVVRLKDDRVVQGGFDDRAAALTWLALNVRTLVG